MKKKKTLCLGKLYILTTTVNIVVLGRTLLLGYGCILGKVLVFAQDTKILTYFWDNGILIYFWDIGILTYF